MTSEESGTTALIERAARGDERARHQLLEGHRARLRRMVALRLDRRVAARVDPSDVVQEALLDAARNLDDYLRQPPLPFYPWLRQFAWERLIDEHRKHLHARRRSVALEAVPPSSVLDQSATLVTARLLAGGTSPSWCMIRDELRHRVRASLAAMLPHDREVIVLRYLEQLSLAEIAATLGISEGAVKSRHMRALLRLRALLDGDQSAAGP
jgi:RNA polymerase sigma-70 factor (ECF subfamily)